MSRLECYVRVSDTSYETDCVTCFLAWMWNKKENKRSEISLSIDHGLEVGQTLILTLRCSNCNDSYPIILKVVE